MLARMIARRVFARAGVRTDGAREGDIIIHRPGFVWKALLGGGSVTLGEAYMRGDWECRRMDLFFERIIQAGFTRSIPNLRERFQRIAGAFFNRQNKKKSRRVGAVHYDIPPAFYERILGSSMNYTSAVWDSGAKTLDEAQHYKMSLVARKLIGLRPGRRVLDIGCGWGALMTYLAGYYRAQCTGISISQEQIGYAKAVNAGTNQDLAFRYQDYRDFDEKVDDVVSICMIEQVGIANLPTYFKKVAGVMSDTGTFVLQVIMAKDPSCGFDGFLEKYIFPGGVLPTIDQITSASSSVLRMYDVHEFPMSYYKTLMAWHANMHRHREWVVAELGETFFRMFEYYLMMCAGAFRAGHVTVAQIVMGKDERPGYVPVR